MQQRREGAQTEEGGLIPAKPGAVICLPVSCLYLDLPSAPVTAKCSPGGVLITQGRSVHQPPALAECLLGTPEARVVLKRRGQARPDCAALPASRDQMGAPCSFLGVDS